MLERENELLDKIVELKKEKAILAEALEKVYIYALGAKDQTLKSFVKDATQKLEETEKAKPEGSKEFASQMEVRKSGQIRLSDDKR